MKKRRKIRILPLAVLFLLILIIGTSFLYWLTCISRPGDDNGLCAKQASQIRVATINISGFRMLSNATTVADFLLAGAQNDKIDVLLIQEYASVYKLSERNFIQMFKRLFPYVITNGEQAIASRFPIISSELTDFPDSPDSFASYLAIDPQGDTISILSVHLQTTGLMVMGKSGQSPKALMTVLSGNDKVRESQAMTVRRKMDSTDYPTIVAGDFNCVPYSKPYRIIKGRNLADTYMEKGHGKGSTFRLLYDVLKIDYILHSKEFECLDCQIQNDYISDHRMVVSTFQKTRL